MSASLTLPAWEWGMAAGLLVATWFLILTSKPHHHKYEVTGVSYRTPAVMTAFVGPNGVGVTTQVLFRCPGGRPDCLRSVSLDGRWELWQLLGEEPPGPAAERELAAAP